MEAKAGDVVYDVTGLAVELAPGTLHLATAPVWRDRMGSAFVLATHDETLALTARAFRFQVIGA